MRLAVALAAPVSPLPGVEYRWDADTDILTARIAAAGAGSGLTGTVEIEGRDGSWLVIEVRGGELQGVEVAVWPDVRNAGDLTPPPHVDDASVAVPSRPSQPGLAAVEVDTSLSAEADAAERTIHFRFGSGRPSRTVRPARDILLDLDDRQQLAGIWMLNVPPFPGAQ